MRGPAALASSFRDPSGFVYRRDGVLYRQVNSVYREHYECLMQSGLYQQLVELRMLIPHEKAAADQTQDAIACAVIRPREVPFVSYPYEWCFSQLKDAALLTLDIQDRAIEHGMTLKDASAYNVQFVDGRPQLIDTLSFEIREVGAPWPAYRQFCQHFLAPLALMSYRDVRLAGLLRVQIDGVPLDLAAKLLPCRSRIRFGVLAHLHLHAKSQGRFADKSVDLTKRRVSNAGLSGLVDNLRSTIKGLRCNPSSTQWEDYYEDTNYSSAAVEHKQRVVGEYLGRLKCGVVWDMGANTGVFSRIAADKGAFVVAFDVDHGAVERNYRDCKAHDRANVLPLVMDLTNPSPGIGWANEERSGLLDRRGADTMLALALVHHLAIANNVPLPMIAAQFARMAPRLIVEFVPKTDSQVRRMLATRRDIFADYHADAFESAFKEHFTIVDARPVVESERVLYLMESHGNRP